MLGITKLGKSLYVYFFRSKHTGKFSFTCEFCSKGFNNYKLLEEHSHIHTGEKPYQCSQCNEVVDGLYFIDVEQLCGRSVLQSVITVCLFAPRITNSIQPWLKLSIYVYLIYPIHFSIYLALRQPRLFVAAREEARDWASLRVRPLRQGLHPLLTPRRSQAPSYR